MFNGNNLVKWAVSPIKAKLTHILKLFAVHLCTKSLISLLNSFLTSIDIIVKMFLDD